MTNRSAVLHAPHELTIEDRAVPEPAQGEVLVRVVAVGICGSDVHYFEHGRIGPYVLRTPVMRSDACLRFASRVNSASSKCHCGGNGNLPNAGFTSWPERCDRYSR